MSEVMPEISSFTETELVHVSHYTPWTGGPNCSRFVNGKCISRMASGERWEDWIGKAAACPKEWPFRTRFYLPDGSEWICLDRGGAIRYGYVPRSWVGVQPTGYAWIDLLIEHPPYTFGSVIEIEFPETR